MSASDSPSKSHIYRPLKVTKILSSSQSKDATYYSVAEFGNNLIMTDKDKNVVAEFKVESTPLGTGSFGTVYLARTEKATEQIEDIVAIKKIDMSKIINLHKLDNEIFILQETSSKDEYRKYLLKTFLIGKNTKYTYIVTEYIKGKDLFDYFIGDENLVVTNEVKVVAGKAICGLINAISILHKKNIVHGDIKLENIMYDENKKEIKLVDFGLSCYVMEGDIDATKYGRYECRDGGGSLDTGAPELIINDDAILTKKTDIWSVGVAIFYILLVVHGKIDKLYEYREYHTKNYKLLSRHRPKYLEEIIQLYMRDMVAFQPLIRAMCKHDPNQRKNIDEIVAFTRVFCEKYKS